MMDLGTIYLPNRPDKDQLLQRLHELGPENSLYSGFAAATSQAQWLLNGHQQKLYSRTLVSGRTDRHPSVSEWTHISSDGPAELRQLVF